MTGTLHEDQFAFLIICSSVIIRMRYISDISCRETQNTRFTLNTPFLDNRTDLRNGEKIL